MQSGSLVSLQAPRLYARRRIQHMSALADMGIDHLTEAIHHTKRAMFRQCVPRIERKVFAMAILFRSIEFLPWYLNDRHPNEGRV